MAGFSVLVCLASAANEKNNECVFKHSHDKNDNEFIKQPVIIFGYVLSFFYGLISMLDNESSLKE